MTTLCMNDHGSPPKRMTVMVNQSQQTATEWMSQMCTPSAERACQAWMRIILRVLSVTMAGPGAPAGPGPPEGPEAPAPCDADLPRPRHGHAHICLGDIMDESITWLEVESEDDQNSPKQCDLVQVEQEEEEEQEGDAAVPSGLKDIYRQQKAPGIVAGMQKCLSF